MNLTPQETRWLNAHVSRERKWAQYGLRGTTQQFPCATPVPHASGTGVCQCCGWQHARRGDNAIERFT